jgi:hypothetical protein
LDLITTNGGRAAALPCASIAKSHFEFFRFSPIAAFAVLLPDFRQVAELNA